MPLWDAPAAPTPVIFAVPERKKSAAVPIAIAALIAIAVIGGFFFMRSRSAAVPQSAATTRTNTTTQAPAPAAASATVATTPTQTLAPAPLTASTATAAPATETALDPAKVNEEVQRRLAAERARLEQLARAQQQQPQKAPAPAPQPPPMQRAVAQPAPQPQPQVPAPQPQVAESRPAAVQPAPQPAAPAPQPVRVQEGDLVTDLDGLTPAHMVRRANVPYPPMARLQRVEGTVLVSALISETGAVLQTRILRGTSRPVGLNEAAEQIVRRSTFSPPMKDGVRVKAWTTVPIDFKL